MLRLSGDIQVGYPHDENRTLPVIDWFVPVTVLPASLLIAVWFLIQLFSGIGSVTNVQSGGAAHAAHVGGFVFGLAAARLLENPLRINA